MRRWQKALLVVLALLLLLSAAGYYHLQKTLASLPVQNLQYQISSLGLRQLHLRDVRFTLPDQALQVYLNDVQLNWRFNIAKLTTVTVTEADVTLSAWPEIGKTPANNETKASLVNNWQLPDYLPDTIKLNNVSLSLPCNTTPCRYQLSLSASQQQGKLNYQLQLSDRHHTDINRLKLTGHYYTVAALPVLYTHLELDNSAALVLNQQLTPAADGKLAIEGELNLTIAPPSAWLKQQLMLYQVPLAEEAISHFSAPLSLTSNWQFLPPSLTGLTELIMSASGRWQVDAKLPSPFALPGIGLLQGQLNAGIVLEQGELSQYRLDSNLSLSRPELPQQLAELGVSADQLQLAISSQHQGPVELTALPLQIALSSQGHSKLGFSGHATINPTPPVSVAIQHANLTLAQPQLNVANAKLNGLDLQSRFNAYWLADRWQIDLQQLTADITSISAATARFDKLKLTSSDSKLSGNAAFSQLNLQSDMQLQLDQLNHSAVKPLSWQWQGRINGTQNDFTLTGRLENAAGLVLPHQLNYQPDNVVIDWQLEDMFFLADNPISNTLNAWPALLEFNRGRFRANGTVTILPNLDSSASFTLSGISGIYDRSLFKDASGTVELQYKNAQLQLTTAGTTVAEIQHGIIAGPLTLSTRYTAKPSAIAAGELDIQQLQLDVMGGVVHLEPQTLDLTASSQQLLLQLQQLDLSQLLKQHPSTDISGNGRISGTIPLHISHSGASVQHGLIAAESPGGKLQYRPATAESMADANPGMKVVLSALDDFHYSVLSSNVSYDTSGKLLLALQLQGNNPALENGRPINLNINLEEDIPALITSLQLSSQISDKIKQRVQQKLQQSGARRANGAQP